MLYGAGGILRAWWDGGRMARRRSETPRTSAHSQLPRRERGEEEVKYEGHKAFERSEEANERLPR